jgi:hypothetical protein
LTRAAAPAHDFREDLMDTTIMTGDMEDLRYPIGRFVLSPNPLTPDEREGLIERLARQPDRLRAAVAGLTDNQLDTAYRPGGWSVRQVVHHLADAHMNAYVRTKLALTEDAPVIKPYQQELWADLADSKLTPAVSVDLVALVHARWVPLLRSLEPRDFARTLIHPEVGTMSLDQVLADYAWDGDHHTAQITRLRDRRGW